LSQRGGDKQAQPDTRYCWREYRGITDGNPSSSGKKTHSERGALPFCVSQTDQKDDRAAAWQIPGPLMAGLFRACSERNESMRPPSNICCRSRLFWPNKQHSRSVFLTGATKTFARHPPIRSAEKGVGKISISFGDMLTFHQAIYPCTPGALMIFLTRMSQICPILILRVERIAIKVLICLMK